MGAYSCSILCIKQYGWAHCQHSELYMHITWAVKLISWRDKQVQHNTTQYSRDCLLKYFVYCFCRTRDRTHSSPWHHHLCYFWRRNRKLSSMLCWRKSLQDQRHDSASWQSACVWPPHHSVSSRQPTTFSNNRWAVCKSNGALRTSFELQCTIQVHTFYKITYSNFRYVYFLQSSFQHVYHGKGQ